MPLTKDMSVLLQERFKNTGLGLKLKLINACVTCVKFNEE